MSLPCKSESTEERYRAYCAFHEAGHVVAGLAVGSIVHAVSIHRARPVTRVTISQRNVHDWMVTLIAGDVAARIALPECQFSNILTRAQARDAIASVRAGDHDEYDRSKQASVLVAGIPAFNDDQLVDFWMDLQWLTERYCNTSAWRVWTKVIAERLLKHETLFGHELEDVPARLLTAAMDATGEPISKERDATMGECLKRSVNVKPSSFDASENTVQVIWTTGAVVRRNSYQDGQYDEELEVTPSAVRLGRLNGGAPLLNTHADRNLTDVIGCVVPGSAKISGGVGTATLKLSSADADADVVAKIRDGIIRNVSVGYVVHKYDITPPTTTSVMVKRAVDWEPMELSFVPVPADAGAMVRSRGTGGIGAAAHARLYDKIQQTIFAAEQLSRRIDALESVDMAGTAPKSVSPSSQFPKLHDSFAQHRRLMAFATRHRE